MPGNKKEDVYDLFSEDDSPHFLCEDCGAMWSAEHSSVTDPCPECGSTWDGNDTNNPEPINQGCFADMDEEEDPVEEENENWDSGYLEDHPEEDHAE